MQDIVRFILFACKIRTLPQLNTPLCFPPDLQILMTSHIQKITDRATRTRLINNSNDNWFVLQNDPNHQTTGRWRKKSPFLVNSIIFCLLLAIFSSCSKDEQEYVTLHGRVVRDITGEGIPNQRALLTTNQPHGTGFTEELPGDQVMVNENLFNCQS